MVKIYDNEDMARELAERRARRRARSGGFGFGFGGSHVGAAEYPATQAMTLWVRNYNQTSPFSGAAAWNGEKSAGTSGSNNLDAVVGPLTQGNVTNARNSLRLDSVTDSIRASSGTLTSDCITTTGYSGWIVAQFTQLSSSGRVAGSHRTDNTGWSMHCGFAGGDNLFITHNNTLNGSMNGAAQTTSPQAWIFSYDGTNVNSFVDSGGSVQSLAQATIVNMGDPMSIGDNANNTADAHIDVYEFGLMQTVFTAGANFTAFVTNVGRYLNRYYAAKFSFNGLAL